MRGGEEERGRPNTKVGDPYLIPRKKESGSRDFGGLSRDCVRHGFFTSPLFGT
jgi:hypothetical protein